MKHWERWHRKNRKMRTLCGLRIPKRQDCQSFGVDTDLDFDDGREIGHRCIRCLRARRGGV